MRWDIFCRVVDNFGDAGVTWRLARQLCDELGMEVRLIIDHLPALARLDRRIDPKLARQCVAGVTIVRWETPFELEVVADVVVETFSCDTPEAVLQAMVARDRPPAWINLEYLSAEEWVGRCHGLPSPHPRYPLTRYFFFPGFDAHTGGLLREADLLARRDAFVCSGTAREGFCRSAGLAVPDRDTKIVTLFGYDTVQVYDLIEVWRRAQSPVLCLIPEGTPLALRVARHLEQDGSPGSSVTRGGLTVAWVPFADQVDYDPLLWMADFNFARGEDSFVRAQWAARPLAWHVYPQSGQGHRIKLEAFLGRYLEGLEAGMAQRYRDLFLAWNGEGDLGRAWAALGADWGLLQAHAGKWAATQGARPDLAHNLAEFAMKLL